MGQRVRGSIRLLRDEDGDFGELGQARVERDLAALEQAVRTGFEPRHITDGETRWKFAETRSDEPPGGGRINDDVGWHELHQAAAGASGGLIPPW